MSPAARHRLAVGGVAGPAAFVAAWAFLGTGQPGYSPVDDPISRLASIGAPTRVPMTAGLLAFGAGVAAYASALAAALPGPAALAAALTATGAVGIAALPLSPGEGSVAHDVVAGLTYASLATTPLLGARGLHARGLGLPARLSTAVGVASAAALAAGAMVPRGGGLLQRLGLTLGHAWIVASAAWIMRGAPAPDASVASRPS